VLVVAVAGVGLSIDRELYLPRRWTDDRDRCVASGMPEDLDFMTKPALAAGTLTRALNSAVAARLVAEDEVGGADPVFARRTGSQTDRLRASHRRRPPRPDHLACRVLIQAMTAGSLG
jgi:SRSO17 transposase